jgi:hypothetical protein
MTARATSAAVVLLALAWPSPGSAQGIGDAAVRERAKRQQQAQAGKPGEVKQFTNDDLEEGRPPGTPASEAEPAPAPDVPAGSGAAPESGQDRASLERPYLDAVASARSAVSAVEARIKELQDRLNPMSINYIYGAAQSGDMTAEEIRVREELREAESQLLQARQALAAADRSLQDFRQGRTSAPTPPEAESY